jgi:hypothetical protein
VRTSRILYSNPIKSDLLHYSAIMSSTPNSTLVQEQVQVSTSTTSEMFVVLVRMAPLVPREESSEVQHGVDAVIDLIHGKQLPHYELPPQIQESFSSVGISLGKYQMDGVTWLDFLHSVNLNDALCDSMGPPFFLSFSLADSPSQLFLPFAGKTRSPSSCWDCNHPHRW